MIKRGILLAGALVLNSTLAEAQDTSGCTKFKWSIAREQTAFGVADLASVASGGALPEAATAVLVKLQPQASVAFVQAPARKPKADPAFAAVLTLPKVPAEGTYQVTLSDDAWIDVLQDGIELRSSSFSGQPACAGIRKSVRFALKPGPATIQISGASVDAVKFDILPAE